MGNVDDNNSSKEHRAKIAKESRINALVSERAGYAARGLDDRVAAVDGELKVLGHNRTEKGTEKETARSTPAGYEKAVK